MLILDLYLCTPFTLFVAVEDFCRTNGNLSLVLFTCWHLSFTCFQEIWIAYGANFKKTLFLLNLIYSYIFLFSYTFHTQRIDEIMKRTRKSDASLEVKVGIQITIMSWVKKSRIHLVMLKVWDKYLEKVDLFSSVQDKAQDGTETWKEREISEMKKVKDSLREVG